MNDCEAHSVGVVGLGLLGCGIATCLLAHQQKAVAFSNDATDFVRMRKTVEKGINELITHAGFPEVIKTRWASLCVEASAVGDLASCDLVIETVTEDLPTKRGVLASLEMILASDVPIATNTSGFSLAELRAEMKHPRRLLAMHWAEPAYATRFMELVRDEDVSPQAFDAAYTLATRIGKQPCVVARDIEGLIVNRLAYAMYREAISLVDQGICDARTLDMAFRNSIGLWAATMGPFRWMDLTGLPAYAKVMGRLWPTLSAMTSPPASVQSLIEGGARGVSNLRGFYEYSEQDVQQWNRAFRENAWRLYQTPAPDID
jgi:3-hydroxybutyryl-CoA dehydrogenase